MLFLEDRAPAAEEGEDGATAGSADEDGPEGAAAAAAADAAFEEAFDGDSLDDDLSDLIAFSDADAERFGLPTGAEQETGQLYRRLRRPALRLRPGPGAHRPGAPQHRGPLGRGGRPRPAARPVRPDAARAQRLGPGRLPVGRRQPAEPSRAAGRPSRG